MKPRTFIPIVLLLVAAIGAPALAGPGKGNFNEGFEAASFPPDGWSLTGTALLWSRSTDCSGYGTGTAAALADFYDVGSGTQDMVTLEFYPSVAGDSVAFDHAYAAYQNTGYIDSLTIWTSANAGSTWTKLIGLRGGAAGPLTTDTTTSYFIPTAAQWRTKRYALPVGTNKVRFRAHTAYGNNLYLDNIRITGQLATHDVGATAILSPVRYQSTSANPQVKARNFSSSTDSFYLHCRIDSSGVTVYHDSLYISQLAAGDTVTKTFGTWTPSLGWVYPIKAWTALAGDQIVSNDTTRDTAFAYTTPRRVMTEMFTATSCPPCVTGNDSMNHIYADIPDTMVLVRYHVWWPTNNDPFYLNLKTDTMKVRQRVRYYGVNGVPAVIVNGVFSPDWNNYRSVILSERTTTFSPLTITLNGTYDSVANTGRAIATLHATGQPVGSSLRLRYLIVQDSVNYTGTNGDPTHHQIYRMVMPDTTGRIITIGFGETVIDSVNFTIPTVGYTPAFVEKNLRVLAYLQDNGSKNIWQCTMVPLFSLTPLGVAGAPAVVAAPTTKLQPCRPNPVHDRTTISYNLASQGIVNLCVYDITGRLVRTLAAGVQSSGSHTVSWNGSNDQGRSVAAGVYIVRLQAGNYRGAQKVLWMK